MRPSAGFILLAVGLLPLVSGCQTVAYMETPPAILVEPAPHVLLLTTRPNGYLEPAESRRLTDFLYTASGGRLDAIHVNVISTHAPARRSVIGTALRMGVAPFKVKAIVEKADDQYLFGVRVVAVRYYAHPPGCPSFEITSPSPNNNDFEPTLGCSTLANLAVNVNDPKDLLGNNAAPPIDGERAAIPVARYRTFGASSPSAIVRDGRAGTATPGEAPVNVIPRGGIATTGNGR